VLLQTKVRDPLAEPHLNFQLAILLGRPQWQSMARYRTQQVSLGEVGALVWKLGFGAHQHYHAGKSGVPQPGGDRIARRAATDDQRLGRLRFSISRRRRSDHPR
jgi:hypothetical protein